MDLLTGNELDALLRWPAGRAERLARRRRLPHYILPDGRSIRFARVEIEKLLSRIEAVPEKLHVRQRMRHG